MIHLECFNKSFVRCFLWIWKTVPDFKKKATDVTSIINMMGKMKLQCMRIVIVTEQNIEKVFSTIKKNIFLNSWETKTLKLAKMAFIGQETVRKQQRHNFLWRMYTLIAVFVHFNRFIDLKINFHTNPYNLASSMLLWFWVPCGKTTNNYIKE